MSSPLQSAQHQLKAVRQEITALTRASDPDIVWKKLLTHERNLSTTLTVTQSGKTKKLKAFRSQHNSALGPFKGGIRFHPQVNADEVQALSMWMTWKCSLLGLPYGGAKGGIALDPTEYTPQELEAISRQYVAWLNKENAIGPWIDVPAPDVNTNPKIMGWMLDEWQTLQHTRLAATFTGKPIILGGSLGREEATGRGGALILRAFAEHKDWDIKKTTVAVQGYGNVGRFFVSTAEEFGFKIVAVSDSSGTLIDPQGLSPAKLDTYKEKYRSFAKAAQAEKLQMLPAEAVLSFQADVLAPAALEEALTAKNAASVQAKTILEMANGPTTPEAEVILSKNGHDVLPDILCNAGGVTVSYLEWVQNLHGAQWTLEQVRTELNTRMMSAFAEVAHAKHDKITWRQAAYIHAVNRVVEAESARRG